MFQTVILAGGLATRLHPLTETIPKSLIPVAGKPFIEWQLDYLSNQGIVRVHLCLGHLYEQVIDFIENRYKSDSELVFTFSIDGIEPLGTGGALLNACKELDQYFFLTYGDSFLPIEFRDVQRNFLRSGKSGLMTILHNRNLWDKSNVQVLSEGGIFYSKKNYNKDMHFIDYGLSILNKDVLDQYESRASAFDLGEIFEDLSLRQQLAHYEVDTRFYEIGTFGGLTETQEFLLKWEGV